MNLMLAILVLPFIASFVGFFLGRRNEKTRDAFNILFTAVEFLLIIMLFPEIDHGALEYRVPNIMGTGLHLKVDMLRYTLLFISGLTWLLTTLYSTQYLIKYKNRNRYYFFFMLTYATTLGVFLSANILNLFTFFEGMSFTSYLLVIHDEDQYSHDAGNSYLSMAIAGGMIMLFGIFLAFDYTGTLELAEMGQALAPLGNMKYVIAFLIMFGFMIKASVFPLHTWLPKAYPAAPAPASAVLSGILMKTGLFGLIIVTVELFHYDFNLSITLYCLGIVNIFLGGILALFQRNIKRIIAYSSMSQTGFMLMGIGLVGILGDEGSVALVGTLLYMINHTLIKVLLFLGIGLIYMIFKDLSVNFIRGFGRQKPGLKLVFFIGLLGLCGVPGFNGYVSKTMLHEAIIEAAHITHSPLIQYSEYLFLLGGSLTVAYMLKLFVAVFMEKNPKYAGQYKSQISKRALIPLGILASLIVIIGLYPDSIIIPLTTYSGSIGMKSIPDIQLYSFEALSTSLITLAVGVFIYIFIVRKVLIVKKDGEDLYINPSLHWLNLEKDIYIPVLKGIFKILSVLFKIIDNMLLHSADNLAKMAKMVSEMDTVIAPKLEWRNLIVDTRTEAPLDLVSLKGTNKFFHAFTFTSRKRESNKKQIGNVLSAFFSKVNTITSSVFLIGFVLVFSLIFIFIVN